MSNYRPYRIYLLKYEDDPEKTPEKIPEKTPEKKKDDFVPKSELEKAKQRTQEVLAEVETLKKTSNLTAKEREELEERLKAVKNELLTKEEQAAKEKENLEKDYKQQVELLTTEKNKWESMYTEETITRSLTDACNKKGQKAYNSEPIVALLKPKTKLIEEIVGEEKTGRLIPKVTVISKNEKTGELISLELTPNDAVKRMASDQNYFNLFDEDGKGGLGKSNIKSDQLDPSKLDFNQYKEWRKTNELR